MEPVLAHLDTHVQRHDHRDDGYRPVRRVKRIAHDRVFSALCRALHISRRGYLFAADTVPWPRADVVAAQSQIHRHVFCGCDGLARFFHLPDVEFSP